MIDNCFYPPLFRSLQQTLLELKDYQNKHQFWMTQQAKLQLDQATPQLKQDQMVSYERHRRLADPNLNSRKNGNNFL